MSDKLDLVRARIQEVPDFPKPGILFKDITPLLADPIAFSACIELMLEKAKDLEIDFVAGIESRGFMFGAAIAAKLNKGFVPIRKPGKLPRAIHRVEYALEYGTDALEVHRDAFHEGARVLIVDDLLATGGTARAAFELVELCGAKVAGLLFVIHLAFLEGAEKLSGQRVESLISY